MRVQRDALVDAQRVLHHPLGAEALRARAQAGRAHLLAQPPRPSAAGRSRRPSPRDRAAAPGARSRRRRRLRACRRPWSPRSACRTPSRRAATCRAPRSPSSSTKMSNALCTDRTSGRKPARITCFSRWCSLICRSSAGAQLAFAGDDEPRVRHLRGRRAPPPRSGAAGPCAARARRRCRRSARGAAATAPRAGSRGGAASTRPRSMPSWTVTVRAAGTPSPISICRIASDAQMKQSTWRYFQRDSALPLQVEVDAPRRDERRLRRAACSSTAPAPPSRRRADRARGRCRAGAA